MNTARSRLLREIGILALFAGLAVLQTWITSDLGRRFYAGPDPMQDVWVLEWLTSHLHRPSELFHADNYFPSRHALLYCDPMLGPALLAAPVRLLADNPVVLYNLAVLTAFTLTGYATYRLARHLGGDTVAAIFAGVLVAHAPPLLAHRAHLNLAAIGGLPLVMLGLLKTFERPHFGRALATGVALGLQAATSGYYALIGALLAVLLCALHTRALLDRRVLASLAVVAVVAAIVVLPYVHGFLYLGRHEVGLQREATEAQHYSIDLPASFLRTKAYVWLPVLGSVYEEPMWPGLTLLAFAVLGARRPDRRARVLLAVAAFFFVLALGPRLTTFGIRSLPLPFALLHELPLFSSVKHPYSFMIPVWITAGLLAARGLQSWQPRHARWRRPLVVGLALVETLQPAPERLARPVTAPAAFALLQNAEPGAVLELPCRIDTDSQQQWASIFHDRPIVNGRGAFCPDSYNRLHRIIRTEWDVPSPKALTETPSFGFFLARFPIRYLIVHPNTPGHIARNVEATPGHFEPMGRAADGAEVYRVRNGGRGREVRRWLRGDQLGRPIPVRVTGAAGARLSLAIHAHDPSRARVLDERTLTGGREEIEWTIPSDALEPGLNNLQLSVDRETLVLESLDWTEPPRR